MKGVSLAATATGYAEKTKDSNLVFKKGRHHRILVLEDGPGIYQIDFQNYIHDAKRIIFLEPVYDLWPRLHLQQFLFKSRRFLCSMQRIGRKKERRYGQKGRTMHLGNRS